MLRALALSAILTLAPVGAAPAYAQETTTFQRQSQRVCSAVVENNWRMAVPVYDTWSADDCMEYARSVGASHVQLGCIFNYRADRTPNRRSRPFTWGDLVPTNGNIYAGTEPMPNCGWRAGLRPR